MLTPLLIQRGYSLDAFSWNEWFTRQFENYSLEAYIRPIEIDNQKPHFEIKVEISRLGIPAIRTVFGYASSEAKSALTIVPAEMLPSVLNWLQGAFDTEYIQQTASVLNAAREMGLRFVTQSESSDTAKYYFDLMAKLAIREEHYLLNTTGVPQISEDRYSAFIEKVDELDFDSPIEGE